MKITKDYFDIYELITNVEEAGFNSVVKCATIGFRGFKDKDCVGRLVQVRKKAAIDGSDIFLIRRSDGSLYSFYNEAVYKLNSKGIDYVNPFFNEVPLDEPNTKYDINGKQKKIGFIV